MTVLYHTPFKNASKKYKKYSNFYDLVLIYKNSTKNLLLTGKYYQNKPKLTEFETKPTG